MFERLSLHNQELININPRDGDRHSLRKIPNPSTHWCGLLPKKILLLKEFTWKNNIRKFFEKKLGCYGLDSVWYTSLFLATDSKEYEKLCSFSKKERALEYNNKIEHILTIR
jgi:hypothetical protein